MKNLESGYLFTSNEEQKFSSNVTPYAKPRFSLLKKYKVRGSTFKNFHAWCL